MIIVSACLAGMKVRYDSSDKIVKDIKQMVDQEKAIAVCPELLGGLQIPRAPAEIVGGDGKDVLSGKAKVMTMDGKDVTQEFIEGARKVLEKAKEIGAEEAILKSKSASCGCGKVHDGGFTDGMIAGDGVTAALLKENGINVYTEENFPR